MFFVCVFISVASILYEGFTFFRSMSRGDCQNTCSHRILYFRILTSTVKLDLITSSKYIGIDNEIPSVFSENIIV